MPQQQPTSPQASSPPLSSQQPSQALSSVALSRIVLGLVAIVIASHAAMGGARLTTSLFALHLGGGAQSVGFILSLMALVPMLFSVAMGRWVDRVGSRLPMQLAILILAASIALPLLKPGLPMLYLSALLTGSVFVIIPLAVQNAIGVLAPASDRQRLFSWLALGFSVSALLGPLSAGYVIDHFGHLMAYKIFALTPIISLIILAFLQHLPKGTGQRMSAESHIKDLLREQGLMRVFIVAAMLATGWDLFGFMLPVYGSAVGLTASQVGLVMSAFAGATLLVRVSIAWQAGAVSEWQVLAMALGFSGLSFALFPFFHSLLPLMVIAAICGAALGSTQPMVMALITTHAPQGRAGEALGLRSAVLNASSFVMPLLFGLTTKHTGFKPSFLLVASLLLAGAAFSWRLAARPAQPSA
jgi:MFS family permease